MAPSRAARWYFSGLIRQVGISNVIIGEATSFIGGQGWLAEHGVNVLVLDDPECVAMMSAFIQERPELWFEDIGEARG